MNTIRKDI